MTLSPTDLERLGALAITAAENAASYIQGEAGRNREVLTKQGGSSHASQVVTEVDFESQRQILELLQPSIADYQLGLLTEEQQDDASRFTHDHFWCIDPLDGTLPFTENVAGYSVSIALVSRTGVPLIGVIADPVTGTTFHARRGAGAYRDGVGLHIEKREAAPLTLVMDRSFAKQSDYEVLLEKTGDIASENGFRGVEIINQGGAAMNAMWVIETPPAIYFKLPKPEDGGGSLWDYAASACIFAELGNPATDISGRPLQLNREGTTFMNHDGIAYASDPRLAKALHQQFAHQEQ